MTQYDFWFELPDRAGLNGDMLPLTERCQERGLIFHQAREAFFVLRGKIKSGAVQGHQTDWGSYAVLMNRADIEALLAEIYGPLDSYEARYAGTMEHLADRMRELRAFVAALPPEALATVRVSEF